MKTKHNVHSSRFFKAAGLLLILVSLSACSKKPDSASTSSNEEIICCKPPTPFEVHANSISKAWQNEVYAPANPALLKLSVTISDKIYLLDSERFYTLDVNSGHFLAPPSSGNLLSSLWPNDANAPTNFSLLRYSFQLDEYIILATSSQWYAFSTSRNRFMSMSELGFANNQIALAWSGDSLAPNPSEVITTFPYPNSNYIIFMTSTHYYPYDKVQGKFIAGNTLASFWGNDPYAPKNSYALKVSATVGNQLFLLDDIDYYQLDWSTGHFVAPPIN